MFVEAKALGQNLNDRKWASQIMGYAAVAGVRWVVLTNGDEYRIYNSHEAVPVEKKLFRIVRVSDEDEPSEETLALLSKESVAELESLSQESFVDRRVQEAIDALFEPEPDEGLVRLLRRRIPPEITTRQLRAALSRLRRSPAEQPERAPAPPFVASARRTKAASGPRAFGEGTPWNAVTLGDLISARRLSPPVDLHRRYKGHDLHARIERDGRVSFDDQVYGSLSVAGSMARRSVIGADQRAQTNGWTFWKLRGADGYEREVDDLRRRLWEERPGAR
jgi:RAMA domain-containing protein